MSWTFTTIKILGFFLSLKITTHHPNLIEKSGQTKFPDKIVLHMKQIPARTDEKKKKWNWASGSSAERHLGKWVRFGTMTDARKGGKGSRATTSSAKTRPRASWRGTVAGCRRGATLRTVRRAPSTDTMDGDGDPQEQVSPSMLLPAISHFNEKETKPRWRSHWEREMVPG